MKRDQVEGTFQTFDGAKQADPSDETVINGKPYDTHKAIRSGAENTASPGSDADIAEQ